MTFSVTDDGLQHDFFTWQPPKGTMGISSFAAKFQAKPRTFWTKNGPDGIELGETHCLTVRYGTTGTPRHVTVTDEKGNILVEMSGQVVVDPDMYTAETLQVDVHNTELNAFGSFSWRFVTLAVLFQLLWQIGKISLSINFEMAATSGRVPWFRNLLAALNWCLTGNIICIEMTAFALTGTRATINTHAVGNVAATLAIMAVAPLQLSEFVLCVVGVTAMILVAPFVHYYNTIGVHENRHFLPHLRWTIAQLSGTVGCFVLFGLIAQSYATLLAAGQSVAATLFLPFGTAFAETGMVVFTRLMYNRLVHSNKLDPETAPLVGDQLFIPAPCLIMSAHAFAEGCRLTATFSGVISGGGWGWISTSLLSVALNLSARLGWTRFMLLQLGKKICNGPKAMALFGPTGWSKYHDELKIYAGYFRFVSVIALCVARLISYGVFEVEGSKAPAFNLSALMVIICLLAAEFVEDQVVTNELLPVNPAGPGLLKMNANGDNADPAQLITLEHLHNVQQGDPWRMWDLETSGKLSLRRTTTSDSVPSKGPGEVTATPSLVVQCASTPIVPQKVVSLGSSEMDRWSRLRKWFGQPRSLNSSPALHGLRELPFAIQLSFVGIVSEFTLGLLALLVGAGYLRGTCENVLVGSDRIVGLIYWSLPLPC